MQDQQSASPEGTPAAPHELSPQTFREQYLAAGRAYDDGSHTDNEGNIILNDGDLRRLEQYLYDLPSEDLDGAIALYRAMASSENPFERAAVVSAFDRLPREGASRQVAHELWLQALLDDDSEVQESVWMAIHSLGENNEEGDADPSMLAWLLIDLAEIVQSSQKH